jgi:hypothetical protein
MDYRYTNKEIIAAKPTRQEAALLILQTVEKHAGLRIKAVF